MRLVGLVRSCLIRREQVKPNWMRLTDSSPCKNLTRHDLVNLRCNGQLQNTAVSVRDD